MDLTKCQKMPMGICWLLRRTVFLKKYFKNPQVPRVSMQIKSRIFSLITLPWSSTYSQGCGTVQILALFRSLLLVCKDLRVFVCFFVHFSKGSPRCLDCVLLLFTIWYLISKKECLHVPGNHCFCSSSLFWFLFSFLSPLLPYSLFSSVSHTSAGFHIGICLLFRQ